MVIIADKFHQRIFFLFFCGCIVDVGLAGQDGFVAGETGVFLPCIS